MIDLKKYFNIGMRTLKTALCVMVCLSIYELLSFVSTLFEGGSVYKFINIAILNGSPSFACIAAVICMQDTVERSKQIALSRVIGSIVGGSFALVFLRLNFLILHGRIYILLSVIGVIAIICICNFLKNPISVSISVITFLIIFVGTDVVTPIYFAFNRVVGTLVGAMTALVINKYISQPKE